MVTLNDKYVLNAIFNPFEPNSYSDDEENNKTCFLHGDTSNSDKELNSIKTSEIEAVKLAEENKLDESLSKFNEIIELNPNYASGYNNRAQVFQLKGNTEKAFSDLEKAIDLADIKGCSCKSNTKVLAQALCQRALIYRLNNDETNSYNDFKKAASYGNEFSKKQVVALNPYAALCNKMLNQMIFKVKNGETGIRA